MLYPGEVGVACGRDAVLPPFVIPKPLAAPVGNVKGGIGKNVVGAEVGVAVIVEAVAVGDVALYPAQRKIHPGQPPGGIVGLLTPDGDVAPRLAAVTVAGGVGIDELHGLHEHTGGTTTWVVDAALVGFQHLHQELDDRKRGV